MPCHGNWAFDPDARLPNSQCHLGLQSRCELLDKALSMSGLILKPAAMYGITEYRTKWLVSVKRDGKNIAKMFAFNTHGGREKALAQAQAWRDEQIHRHPQLERREHAQRVKRNNTSGIPGVRCQLWPDGRPMRWVVHTSLGNGVILTKSFGVKSHGYEQAKQMAIATRKKHLEQLKGRLSRHPADAVDLDVSIPVADIRHQPRVTKTGIVGVTRTYSKTGNPQSWQAKTSIGGKHRIKSFAIAEYGEERAKALAIAERQKQLERVAHLIPPKATKAAKATKRGRSS